MQGVIFSVIYDPSTYFICSTSDDRTVRLWKVINKTSYSNIDMSLACKNYINWEKAEVKLVKTMFGHAARVWRAIIRNGVILTIGEVGAFFQMMSQIIINKNNNTIILYFRIH